jgi:hypothetical protein
MGVYCFAQINSCGLSLLLAWACLAAWKGCLNYWYGEHSCSSHSCSKCDRFNQLYCVVFDLAFGDLWKVTVNNGWDLVIRGASIFIECGREFTRASFRATDCHLSLGISFEVLLLGLSASLHDYKGAPRSSYWFSIGCYFKVSIILEGCLRPCMMSRNSMNKSSWKILRHFEIHWELICPWVERSTRLHHFESNVANLIIVRDSDCSSPLSWTSLFPPHDPLITF